jgi:hypothetical protein
MLRKRSEDFRFKRSPCSADFLELEHGKPAAIVRFEILEARNLRGADRSGEPNILKPCFADICVQPARKNCFGVQRYRLQTAGVEPEICQQAESPVLTFYFSQSEQLERALDRPKNPRYLDCRVELYQSRNLFGVALALTSSRGLQNIWSSP